MKSKHDTVDMRAVKWLRADFEKCLEAIESGAPVKGKEQYCRGLKDMLEWVVGRIDEAQNYQDMREFFNPILDEKLPAKVETVVVGKREKAKKK